MKRFRFRKVTPEIAEDMRLMKDDGYTTQAIARYYEVDWSCVHYWTNEVYRQDSLNRAMYQIQRQRFRKDYEREYCYSRYHQDPEYRYIILSKQRSNYQRTKKGRDIIG